MYPRDEIRALTDKVLNMAKADAVEVNFDGGERSATRWANSSITVNMVQYDQQLTLIVRHGRKQGSASTREFDEDWLKAMVDEAQETAQKARDNPNLSPLVKGPQCGGLRAARSSPRTSGEAARHGAQGSRADAVARDAHDSRGRRARDRARTA